MEKNSSEKKSRLQCKEPGCRCLCCCYCFGMKWLCPQEATAMLLLLSLLAMGGHTGVSRESGGAAGTHQEEQLGDNQEACMFSP